MNDPLLLRHESAAELYLIRHGDALPGVEEIIPSGMYNDLPLSKKGREQAQRLAARLEKIHFDAAYSSPLRRCQETATPLLASVGLTPTIIHDIREVELGNIIPIPEAHPGDNLEVLTQALQARQVEMVRIAGTTGSWDGLTTEESSRTFRQRVVHAIDEIAARHIGERVLVFCHGGVINAYAAETLALTKDFFYPCANTSITVVRVANPSTRVLFVLNDIAHLSSQDA
jgi:2,3-bisphosphoglycerate-dependent phosphoglycerate mutase